MLDILHREFVYLWYYFELQLRQIFPYWALGMVLGSVISVFCKQTIHSLFGSIQDRRLGALGVVWLLSTPSTFATATVTSGLTTTASPFMTTVQATTPA